MATYSPVILSARMSDFGYWVVDVSIAPDKTVSVMIAQPGITEGEARQLAVSHLPPSDRSAPV